MTQGTKRLPYVFIDPIAGNSPFSKCDKNSLYTETPLYYFYIVLLIRCYLKIFIRDLSSQMSQVFKYNNRNHRFHRLHRLYELVFFICVICEICGSKLVYQSEALPR